MASVLLFHMNIRGDLLISAVRRWRWEWLAIIFALLVYGFGGYSCSKIDTTTTVTAEESQKRFDSAIFDAEKVLKDFGATFYEAEPWDDVLYMRNVEGAFSNGKINIELKNESGLETYSLQIITHSAETPEKALPDGQVAKMFCEVFSRLVGEKITLEKIEKEVSSILSDTHKNLAAMQISRETDTSYHDHRSFGKIIFSDDIYIGVYQDYSGKYFSQMRIVTRVNK